jgi:hypothetical protein
MLRTATGVGSSRPSRRSFVPSVSTAAIPVHRFSNGIAISYVTKLTRSNRATTAASGTARISASNKLVSRIIICRTSPIAEPDRAIPEAQQLAQLWQNVPQFVTRDSDGEPRLFKGRIIIGIDIVDATNRAAILKKPAREAKSDKACRAGD